MFCMFPDSKSEWRKRGNRSEFHSERNYYLQNWYFSDLKIFANSRPSASNFKSFSWSLEQFFLTVGQNNFGNKLPFLFSFLKAKVLFCKEKPDRCMKFTGLFLVKLTFRLRDLQSFSKQWLLFSSHLSQEHQLHNKVNKVVKFSILETGW